MSGGAARLDDVVVWGTAGRPGRRARCPVELRPRRRLHRPGPGRRRAHRRRRAPGAAGSDRDHPDPARAAPGVRPAGVRHAAARHGCGVGGRAAGDGGELDAAAAWHSVLERSTDRALRRAGLKALTETAARCARWRTVVGTRPAVPVFPGCPRTVPHRARRGGGGGGGGRWGGSGEGVEDAGDVVGGVVGVERQPDRARAQAPDDARRGEPIRGPGRSTATIADPAGGRSRPVRTASASPTQCARTAARSRPASQGSTAAAPTWENHAGDASNRRAESASRRGSP